MTIRFRLSRGALALGALVLACASLRAQDAAARPDDAKGDAQGGAPATMLRLYDGSILWGEISEHDAEGVTFVRLDNGGSVRLVWSKLDPALADELLERFGYVDHSGEELMIEADRIVLSDGSDLIGRIVNRTDSELWLKTSSTVFPVPKLRIKASTVVQVPALEVFTREELYQQESARTSPTTAEQHKDLARFCERILDFAHAHEHYAMAAQLDPSFEAKDVAAAIERTRVKAENQKQHDLLREVDSFRMQGKYDLALARLEAFDALYPESSLRADAAKRKTQVLKAREAALNDNVAGLWHTWAGRLTQNAARNPDMTLEAAMAWLDEGLRQEIVDALVRDLQRSVSKEIDADKVLSHFKARKDGRFHKASYGAGTWLLGEQEARKGMAGVEQAKGDAPTTEKDEERKKLEDRVKRYLQNQEVVRKSKASANEAEDKGKFWNEWGAAGRAQWMLAYYVEHSGDMQVRNVTGWNCPDCGGRAVREMTQLLGARTSQQGANTNSSVNDQLVSCLTCHGIGVFRRVSYR